MQISETKNEYDRTYLIKISISEHEVADLELDEFQKAFLGASAPTKLLDKLMGLGVLVSALIESEKKKDG